MAFNDLLSAFATTKTPIKPPTTTVPIAPKTTTTTTAPTAPLFSPLPSYMTSGLYSTSTKTTTPSNIPTTQTVQPLNPSAPLTITMPTAPKLTPTSTMSSTQSAPTALSAPSAPSTSFSSGFSSGGSSSNNYVTSPNGAIYDPTTGRIIKQSPQVSTATTGGGAAPSPSVPAAPSVTPSSSFNLSELEKSYQDNLNLSPEEMAAQAERDRLQESFRKGYQNIEDQAIPMEFITGQQQSLEKRALNLAEPLEATMARLQAKRQASLEASKFALERADKAQERTEKQTAPMEVGGSIIKFNPATGKYESVYSSPTTAGDGFTLSPGQQRYDAAGNLLASVGAEEEGMTPYQAAQLALERDKFNLSKVDEKNLTVDQAKARQFAGAASQANTLLQSLDYNPGLVEIESLPNALKSADRQQFEQASRQFVNAILRRESGATITDDEFLNKYRELIPKAGDSDAVKEQKALARTLAVQSIYQAGGYGSSQPQQTNLGSPPTSNPFLEGSFNDPVFKNESQTSLNGSTAKKVVYKYPTGVTGGQCTTFLHKIVQFPPIGDGKLEKYASVDRIGQRADQWRRNPRVGDVVVSGDNKTYGHTYAINYLSPDRQWMRVTESNYKGNEKVSHERWVSVNDPMIYGAIRPNSSIA